MPGHEPCRKNAPQAQPGAIATLSFAPKRHFHRFGHAKAAWLTRHRPAQQAQAPCQLPARSTPEARPGHAGEALRGGGALACQLPRSAPHSAAMDHQLITDALTILLAAALIALGILAAHLLTH